MGLGKTIQVLALLLLRKQHGPRGTSLLIVPASILGNWRGEIERFAPGLGVLLAHPSAMPSWELRGLSPEEVSKHDVVITSYGFLSRLPWAASFDWDLLVLDEAQAIKNPSAKQTRAVKLLHSHHRVVLTGTPVENRLSDLWSIFDFVNPGLLGPAKTFKTFSKRLEQREQDRYAPLRRLIRPYILRRLKTDRRIIADLRHGRLSLDERRAPRRRPLPPSMRRRRNGCNGLGVTTSACRWSVTSSCPAAGS